MAHLDITATEAEQLRDVLDIEIDAWESEVERICEQPFDTWEALLKESEFPSSVLTTLQKVRKQVIDNGRGGSPETV
jgi:transposase-like protein